MANVNYYVNFTPIQISTLTNWGDQDIDGDGVIDGGTVPLEMKLYPNNGYYLNADMLTIKGYEPTSTGPNGERIWENGETTTDVNGNSVTVNLIDVDKIEIFNANEPTIVPENFYDSSNVVFPPASQAHNNAVGLNDPWNEYIGTVGGPPLSTANPHLTGMCNSCGYPIFGDLLPAASGYPGGYNFHPKTNYLFDVFGGDFIRDTTIPNLPYVEPEEVASLYDYAINHLTTFQQGGTGIPDPENGWPTIPSMLAMYGDTAKVYLIEEGAGSPYLQESISLDGNPMQNGDLVGVFGQNLDGTYTCYGLTEWSVDDPAPYQAQIIPVMGKNASGIGMGDGQEMHIFIKQLSTGDIYKATNIVSGFTWPAFGVALENPWEFNDGWVWGANGGNAWKQYYIQQIEFTNWSQNNLIISDNFVVVKAWLNNNYVVPPEYTQIHLDIDGDAAQIPGETPSNSVNITLRLAEGENSNCRVHVRAKRGITYSSGDYLMPTSSQYILEDIYGANEQKVKVSNIISTGEIGYATVQLTPTEGSDGQLLSTGYNAPSDQEERTGRLSQLFYFYIEPLPGHALHQGWLAPVIESGFCGQVGGSGQSSLQKDWWGNEVEGNPADNPNGLFEIYQNSPLSIIPGGENNTISSSWLSCTQGQGTATSGACEGQSIGNDCYWPGFTYQWSKCAAGTWSDNAPGVNSSYTNCQDSDGNEYDPANASEWNNEMLGGNVWSWGMGSPLDMEEIGFPNTNNNSYNTQIPGQETYSGIHVLFEYNGVSENGNIATGSSIKKTPVEVYNGIHIKNSSGGGFVGSNTVGDILPWGQSNNSSTLSEYSVADFVNNTVTVDIARSLQPFYIGELNSSGIPLTDITFFLGGKALPINGVDGSEEINIIIDADDISSIT